MLVNGVAISLTCPSLVQAISRLFFSLCSMKYPRLISFKRHYLLIVVHWLTAFILPLPSLITDDIYFCPNQLCWVPLKSTVTSNIVSTVFCTTNRDKRDLEVLRKIVIFLGIYISGGIPMLLFMLTANGVFYYIRIVTITFSVAVEKNCTIVLDRDLRQVIKPTKRVLPRPP